MSLFFRGQEQRWGQEPPVPRNSELGRPALRSSEISSSEDAMRKIAIASSVRLLASIIEMLPRHVYTGEGEAKRRIATPGWLEDLDGEGYGTTDWLTRGMYSHGLRGNIVGRTLARDPQTGKPRQIRMYHPDAVTVSRSGDRTVWRYLGKEIPAADLYHRRIFAVPGQTLGSSPVAQHALTLGLGLSAEQFGAQFFMDGGHPTAMFKNTEKKLTDIQATTIKDRFMATVRGRREPLVVGSDWDYQQLQVSPNDSQFLSTFGYTNTECARIFGPGMPEMLGYETGNSMTYSNIEQRALDLLTFTVDPWLCRFENLVSDLLSPTQYMKFERKALLRTDVLTRFKVHEIALRNEIEVVNEVRQLEDLSAVEWGNEPRAKKGDSAARMLQQMCLAIGKIVTAEEARKILASSGVDIDPAIDLDVLHANLPPQPAAPDVPSATESEK